MVTKIKRYDPSYYGEMERANKGAFVTYKDHQKAIRKLKAKIASLKNSSQSVSGESL